MKEETGDWGKEVGNVGSKWWRIESLGGQKSTQREKLRTQGFL